ncbi:SWIM zinc finger family protein [Streptomyces sp. NPDC056061]|uniref:SWIM zinc finger family protein n=1 Tax=Streptomyces sp. NPDC056061 TaxID=3345700 RepID=UPI0035DF5257
MLLSHGGESSSTAAAVVRWTRDQVLALAPDEASRRAGSTLGASGSWSGGGCDGSGAVWGLCGGGGSTPYRTVVDTTGPAYTCSCPSRKSPCKHALGLLLVRASDESALPAGEVPDWADEWLTSRRGGAEERKREGETKGGSENEGGAAGGVPASGPADPEAARRRAERRAERITGGALELEQRLADLLRGGLATADQPGYGMWEETAARMVDAQAPGLAGRVRELGAVPASGPGWPVRLLEECALLHLLDSAWLGIGRLPEPLAATVRTRVGLTTPAEGPPVRDHWLVLAQYDTPDGRIVTRRIWLHGRRSGRTALLLSFGAAGRAPGQALPVGATIDAEITPYPGAGRLRAELGQRFGSPSPAGTPPPGGTTTDAVNAYGAALRRDPWLDAWPVTLCDVIPVPSGDGWQLVDAAGDTALPLAPAATARPGLWRLLALSGGSPVTVFGECGHRGFDPLAAWAADADTVPETVPLI